MARTKRYPAWTRKANEFEGDHNKWWLQYLVKRHHGATIDKIIQVENRKGKADGIGRNAPAWYRRDLTRQFRSKQNNALRSAVVHADDMDALIIEPRQRRNANWSWF